MTDEFEVPAAKRQKLSSSLTTTQTTTTSGSRLFAPFRTVGLVSPTAVPFTSVALGKTTFQITTSIGKRIQTYDLTRGLNLVFLSSPPCPETVTATCAYRDRVLVAWGDDKSISGHGIWIFKRGKLQHVLEQDGSISQEIKRLTCFGNWIVGSGTQGIDIWKADSHEHYTSISAAASNSVSDPFTGHLCTLPTFINKIFVGRTDGSIQIYNVSTGRLVHTIISSGTKGAVTALEPAPAVGLLAAAWSDGTIKIINVETEEIITSFGTAKQSHAVISISFRSDGQGAGQDGRSAGIMATASTGSGDVTLWDLNRGGKVSGVLRGAHDTWQKSSQSGITRIEFLAGQSVMITSGLDNSLKSWIFDQVPFSTIPRILHQRSGHASSVSTLKFLPAATDGSEVSGKWLLSGGNDRSLWGFSLRKDGQSTELSQGQIKHKAKKIGGSIADESHIEDFKCPPVIDIACSLNRDGGMGAVGGPIWTNATATNAEEASMTGWESVVTAHANDKHARTWFWGRKRAGRWAFKTPDDKPVSSVAITACGTFALVGSDGGCLDMFNLQSGAHRQRFPPRLQPNVAKQYKAGQLTSKQVAALTKGHTDSISGIVVDSLNQSVVSASLDSTVIFWNFTTGQRAAQIQLDGVPVSMRYNYVSGLVAMACDDLCIRIVDIETRRVVRELWGCVGQIYDHCFSHHGRWIVSSSMDSIVRVFDIATGHLIDAFKTNTCTNVAFSSTGEFLATAHSGETGINIWSNKALYTTIPHRQVDESKQLIDLTSMAEFQAASQLAADEPQDDDALLELETTSDNAVEQLDKSLLTLSLQPHSRWQTLLNLESVRQRNKPVQPVEKPKAAPFFLGSALMNGTTETNGFSQPAVSDTTAISADERSRVSRLASLQPVKSVMSTHITTFKDTTESQDLITYLSGLSPSAADLEVRSLSIDEMPVFVQALTQHLQQRRDFELVNTWMAVFLKIHSEFVAGIDDLRLDVLRFQDATQAEQSRLTNSVGWSRGVVEYLRSAR